MDHWFRKTATIPRGDRNICGLLFKWCERPGMWLATGKRSVMVVPPATRSDPWLCICAILVGERSHFCWDTLDVAEFHGEEGAYRAFQRAERVANLREGIDHF